MPPTMITSDFTLEVHDNAKRRVNDQRWTIYPSRSKMPRQLARLDVPEASWHYVYDAAEKLADRIHARERGKAGLDNGFVNTLAATSKRAERLKDAAKGKIDDGSLQIWQEFRSCCMSRLEQYGVTSADLLSSDKDGKSVYGIAFVCDASRLRPNKLALTYRRGTAQLSWPRKPIPAELASLGVGRRVWTKIWDETKITAEEAERLSRTKERLSSVHRHDDTVSKVLRVQEEKSRLGRHIEHEWRDLLDYATDKLFMYGISVTLKSVESDRVYSGLSFRFRPIIPAVVGEDAVSSTHTVATAVPVSLSAGAGSVSQCHSEMSVASSYCSSMPSAPPMET
mmetsp:Transcript_7530/g.17334  ORF Transcript_7530/g.17334 Transcript_7530/m.17334 type:complete len:339 (-) Transcript_7530:817-1833(-)